MLRPKLVAWSQETYWSLNKANMPSFSPPSGSIVRVESEESSEEGVDSQVYSRQRKDRNDSCSIHPTILWINYRWQMLVSTENEIITIHWHHNPECNEIIMIRCQGNILIHLPWELMISKRREWERRSLVGSEFNDDEVRNQWSFHRV
jgi:hypothetical protein